MIAPSACVERSNSIMGFIHSKLRSRLDSGKVIIGINIETLRDIAEEEALAAEEYELLEDESVHHDSDSVSE